MAEIARVAGVDGRGAERARGGAARLHRRHQDARPSGRGRDRRWSTSAAAPRRSCSAPSARGCARCARSRSAPGSLADDFLVQRSAVARPRSAAVREHIADFFDGVELEQPDQAVAVGGSATSLRTLVGAVLEYETLERAIRVLTGDPIARRRQALRARSRAGFGSCPPACCCSRSSPSSSASRFRSARAACARASSSTC